jgi:hypothetical protein
MHMKTWGMEPRPPTVKNKRLTLWTTTLMTNLQGHLECHDLHWVCMYFPTSARFVMGSVGTEKGMCLCEGFDQIDSEVKYSKTIPPCIHMQIWGIEPRTSRKGGTPLYLHLKSPSNHTSYLKFTVQVLV